MTVSKFIFPAALFLVIIASGFWVAKTGKPYNTGILTLHKLASLAAVVLTIIFLTKLLKVSPAQVTIILLIIVAGLSVIALFASGGLLSGLKDPAKIWLIIHQISPFLLAGSAVTAILLLLRQK